MSTTSSADARFMLRRLLAWAAVQAVRTPGTLPSAAEQAEHLVPLRCLQRALLPPAAQLHSTAQNSHGGGKHAGAETITVTYQDDKDSTVKTVQVPIGQNLLEAAHEHDVDLEGACECSLACSTCHVIVQDQDYFDRIPEADDDENDLLDLAFGLTDTSRLGCQVIAAKDLDGIRVRIPSATRNFAVDGYVPKPH